MSANNSITLLKINSKADHPKAEGSQHIADVFCPFSFKINSISSCPSQNQIEMFCSALKDEGVLPKQMSFGHR